MIQSDFIRFIENHDRKDLSWHDLVVGDIVMHWVVHEEWGLCTDLVIGDIVKFTNTVGELSVHFRSISQSGRKVARSYLGYHRSMCCIIRRT